MCRKGWVLLLVLLGASCLPASTPVTSPVPTPPPSGEVRAYALLKGCVLLLEVADTPQAQARGLMGRPSLPPERGMIFVFERERPLVFWMKDTLIPLDILFLDGEGRIVDIRTMVPEPGVPPERLTRYRSRAPARYAIEMNAGMARALGLRVGDTVRWAMGPPPEGMPLCGKAPSP